MIIAASGSGSDVALTNMTRFAINTDTGNCFLLLNLKIEVVENESSMNTTSEQSQDELLWCGYKFVGDVDKNVKPSRQRQEIKGKSLHYFHAYAAKDQVNLALLSECPPPKSAPDPNLLLPPAADVLYVMEEISILMSR